MLIAAGQEIDGLLLGLGRNVEFADQVLRCPLFGPQVEHPEVREISERGCGDVAASTEVEEQTVEFAVLGNQRQPGADGVYLAAKAHRCAIQHQSPGGQPVGSEQGPRNLGSAAAQHATKAKHLTAMQRERGVPHPGACCQPTGLQHDLGAGVAVFRIMFADLFADHGADDVGDIDPGLAAGAHHAPAAQDGDLVDDPLHLVEAVRDIKDRRAAGAHGPQ